MAQVQLREQTLPLKAADEDLGHVVPKSSGQCRRWASGAAAAATLLSVGFVAAAALRTVSPAGRAPALTAPGGAGPPVLGLSRAKACRKVYIDTDVGIDDNIALISAFGQHHKGSLCIIGIGVTDGNIPAWISDHTMPRLLALFGGEDLYFSTPKVPEGKSGDIGLLFLDMDGNYQPEGGRGAAEHIHGKAGMGGMAEFLSLGKNTTFPHRDTSGDPGKFLEQRLKAECGEKDCDVLVLGPLTNIVAADKNVLAKHVDRVIWMGGSFVKPAELAHKDLEGIDYVPLHRGDWNVGLRRRGNIAPLSEFNAWAGSVPLAKFLTERNETVGFDMIPLDVTAELMWSPKLIDDFEAAAGVTDDKAWNSKKFRDGLMDFRAKHPGTTKADNKALAAMINNAWEKEMVARRKSNFSYPRTPGGRATFIRDISVKGWASTVADGQIPQKAVANLAHDAAVLAYELNGDLFEAGKPESISVVVKGKATDKLWDALSKEHFMKKRYSNSQWGARGAPIKGDLKGAVFEQSDADDAQVEKDMAKKGFSKDLQIKSGKARVVEFARTPGEPKKAERQVMDWLANALAQAIGESSV